MPSRAIGEERWQAVASLMTALACAALLSSTLARPAGHRPLAGTRTAVELLANGSHRFIPQRAILRAMT